MPKEMTKKYLYPIITGLSVFGLNAMGASTDVALGTMLTSALLQSAQGLFGELFGGSVGNAIPEKWLQDAVKHPTRKNEALHEALGGAVSQAFHRINEAYRDECGDLPEIARNLADIADVCFEVETYEVTSRMPSDANLLAQINDMLQRHKKELGDYSAFFQNAFPIQFQISFGEQLQTNLAAWVTFQCEIYEHLTHQGSIILAKQDDILAELQAIRQDNNAETPILKQKLSLAITKWGQHFKDIKSSLRRIEKTTTDTHKS